MHKVSLQVFALQQPPLERFSFPRWQALLAVALIGALNGLHPSFRAGTPSMPGMPLWLAIGLSIMATGASFMVIVAILKWWMKRGGRWNGKGELFNLVMASCLVADTLAMGLIGLGMPPLLTLPLWVYSVWVAGNALSGAIPNTSLGYAITGIMLTLIPAGIVSTLVMTAAGILMAELGWWPMAAGQ